jgi:type VI secretion system secreted protein VgrG
MRSKTHKGAGYNAMELDDTAGKEKVSIHAQYDMDTTVGHDDVQTVTNDRKITVDGTHTETIKKATVITVSEGTYSHDVAKGTATYHAKGAVDETYDATMTTTVAGDVTVKSKNATITIDAKSKITLHTGGSLVEMTDAGDITISGKTVTIFGSQEVKIGVGAQSVTCSPQSVQVSGAAINATAVGVHEISGALVKIN